MNPETTKAVFKALERNHKNGPLTAKNLVNIYKHIIGENQGKTPEQIAALINEEDIKSDQEDEKDDKE